jgi:hypothetical protein
MRRDLLQLGLAAGEGRMRIAQFACLLCCSANLHAAVVTFEEVTPTLPCGYGAPVPCLNSINTPQGFVFADTTGPGVGEIYVTSNGPTGNSITTATFIENNAAIRISHESGQAFDLHSMDVGRYGESQQIYTSGVSVYGYDEANNLIASIYVEAESGGWVNLGFNDSWNFVHSVVLDSQYQSNAFGFGYLPPRLDNFSASVVPIPAAVWLFGSALAGLGWLRRKQAA